LVAGVDHALVSGERLAGSLNVTLTNAESLMKQLRVVEPTTHELPFNTLNYAKTADEVDIVAKDLNALISSINQTLPGIQRLRQQTAAVSS
jgi:hypothetical protein